MAWHMPAYWVPRVAAERKAIRVAMDWTDFEADGQATIVLSLVTRHGRTRPHLAERLKRRTQAQP